MAPIADWILESEEIKKKLDEIRERWRIFLQTIEGVTVTRFAFYPNGALHLGHARTIILNAMFSFLNKGKFIFIFDDTNPVNIDEEKFYRWAEEDLKWLGIAPDEIIKISDDIQLYHERTRELIEEGKAYLCNCPREIDEERERRHRTDAEWSPCEHRKNSVEENLNLFERVLQGIDTASVVKFKMPFGETEYHKWKIVSENRDDWVKLSKEYHDWIMLRYVDESQHLQPRIKVWPTMHFSVCGFDNEYRISHIIRGFEHLKNVPPQKMLHSVLGTAPLVYTHASKIKAKYSRKSAIKKAILDGRLSDWDDPCCFTLRALRRRGIRPEAIWLHIFSLGTPRIGTSKIKTVQLSEENLGACNRIFYKDRVQEHTFIANPVEIEIDRHPDILIGGSELEQYQGRTVYLRDAGAFHITERRASYIRNRIERGDPFLYWLPADEDKTIHATLITGNAVSGDTQNSDGAVECECGRYHKGTVIFLHKIGYICIDSQNPLVFVFGHKE